MFMFYDGNIRCIYKITSPSGRVYIGQTINFNKRISRYRTYHCKSQKVLYRSLIKYTFEMHVIEIIKECQSDELNDVEIKFIKDLQTNICKYPNGNGLNMTDGGKSVKGIIRTQKHKNAISKANKGRKMSQATKDILYKIHLGKRASIETRSKMSKSRKGKSPSSKTRQKIANSQGKKVLDKSTGIIYLKCKDAAQALGIKDVTLRSWLRGDRPNKSNMIYV